MATSKKQLNLRQKMSQVSKNIGFIEFDSRNEHFKYGYASAASMIKRFNKEFAEVGIVCTVQSEHSRENSDGTCTNEIMLAFHDCDSDEVLDSWGVGCGKDSGDKGPMKASTAAFKYALSHAFMLGWAADDPEDSKGDSSKKAAKPVVDKTLLADISKAKDAKALTLLRDRVILLSRDSVAGKEARAAFTAKKESF